MPKTITLGTVTSEPGTIQYGRWEALSHPTGHAEFLPVIIAQGKEDGTCLWLTAGIHGPEQAGPLVLYRLLTQELVADMKGTIVAIPVLNPAGQRTSKREPYHAPKDPNRLWPDGKPKKPQDPDKTPPSSWGPTGYWEVLYSSKESWPAPKSMWNKELPSMTASSTALWPSFMVLTRGWFAGSI